MTDEVPKARAGRADRQWSDRRSLLDPEPLDLPDEGRAAHVEHARRLRLVAAAPMEGIDDEPPFVLTHRIMISPTTRLRGRALSDVLMDVIETVPVPVESI